MLKHWTAVSLPLCCRHCSLCSDMREAGRPYPRIPTPRFLSFSQSASILSLSLTHTHTNTHQRKRKCILREMLLNICNLWRVIKQSGWHINVATALWYAVTKTSNAYINSVNVSYTNEVILLRNLWTVFLGRFISFLKRNSAKSLTGLIYFLMFSDHLMFVYPAV